MKKHLSTIEWLEVRRLLDDSPHVGDFVPDRSFANDGVYDRILGDTYYSENAMFFVASLPGGKVLTAGPSPVEGQTKIARLNHDGSLDTSFSSDGIAGPFINATKALLQSDGKLLLFARADGMAPIDSAVASGTLTIARINTDGSLDATFGTAGQVVRTFDVSDYDANVDIAAAFTSDGQLVVAVQSAISTPPQNNDDRPDIRGVIRLMRFTSDGDLDTAFGNQGIATVDPAPGALQFLFPRIAGLAIQSTGRIVLAGDMAGLTYVARVNADGSADSSFAVPAGATAIAPGIFQPPTFTSIDALTVQSDDKILVGGNLVMRFNANGSIDSGFGVNGVAQRDLSDPNSVHFAAIDFDIDSGGNINVLMSYLEQFTYVFRFTSAGEPDPTTTGGYLFGINPEFPQQLALENDNTFLLALGAGTVARVTPQPGQTLTTDGTLVIIGDAGDNTITLAPTTGGNAELNYNGTKTTYPAADIKALEFTGFAGDDELTVTLSLTGHVSVLTGQGDNRIQLANVGDANIVTGAGRDTVQVGDGDVSVLNDGYNPSPELAIEIMVGNGCHSLQGGEGNDTIVAGDGDSSIYTGQGNDSVISGNGNDDIDTGEGDDTVHSGGGDDFVRLDSGSDRATLGAGNDTVFANNYDGQGVGETNLLEGGDGDDALVGSSCPDTIRGGAGRDTIWGYEGADLLAGGGGKDKIAGMGGHDHIYGNGANDQLDGGTGNDRMLGGDGTDKLFAGRGVNILMGGAGADHLFKSADDVHDDDPLDLLT